MITQYITDDTGNKVAVILPIKAYNKMMRELDELHDVRAYDKAKSGKQEFVDIDDAFREVESLREKENV